MTTRMGVVAAALCAGLLTLPIASADTPQQVDRKPAACVHALHSAEGANALVRSAWNHKKVKKSKGKIARVRHNTTCPKTQNAKRHIKGLVKDQRKRYKKAKLRMEQLASLTPYNCGEYGYWAIPCAIIACESGYRWEAYNPSGARGPYQFLGWNVPWPVRSEADKLAHHQMAARLWNGGAGRSHWVC